MKTSARYIHYSDEDLKRILNVSILNRNGIKISHIVSLNNEEILEKIQIITRDSSDYNSLIENLVISMVDLDEGRIEKLLSRAIMQIGFEECILKIIYPFFDKIGILWQTGAINPAQEHFVSNLVRQKLITGIDSMIPLKNDHPKHFLLFLPEGELHELGLLFYSYLLKKRGHKVTYLGQWVPLRDMLTASTVMDFGFLLTSVIAVFSGEDFSNYLKELSSAFPEKTIFISGLQVNSLKNPIPANVIALHKVEDLFPHIA